MPSGFSWSEIGVDPARVHVVRDAPMPSRGEYVLYWCMVNQRVLHNHALQAAIALGNRRKSTSDPIWPATVDRTRRG